MLTILAQRQFEVWKASFSMRLRGRPVRWMCALGYVVKKIILKDHSIDI